MSIIRGIWRTIGRIVTFNAFMGFNFGVLTLLTILLIRTSDSQPVGLWIVLVVLSGMTWYAVRNAIADWREPDSQS